MMNSTASLLLVDDDIELCDLLSEYLKGAGVSVQIVNDGIRGVEFAITDRYDLVILDVMMPGLDGFEALRRIRNIRSELPIIMLTARGRDSDRIAGLELGADDYLPKPFNPQELLARIRAVLRRSQPTTQQESSASSPDELDIDDIHIDLKTREVTRQGESVTLTAVEFSLLAALVRSAGEIVTRDELFVQVLGRAPDPIDRSIDIHVSHLRKKLGKIRNGVERIKSVRGVGYVYTCTSAVNGN